MLTAVTQGHKIVSVADQHGAVRCCFDTASTATEIPDPCGLLHPVQRNVQQQRTDHATLRRALLRRSEMTLVDHTRCQPVPDQSSRRKCSELVQKMIVIDTVERRRQVRVEHPQALRVTALDHLIDCFDRVVATAARPESVGFRFEPRLPLRFQRVLHACLKRAINDDRNSEWTLFAACLRDEHSLDRSGLPRLGLLAHPIDQRGLADRGRDDPAVDARRLATSVVLGHAPHAQQRVGARPQHQLLQVADLLEVPCLTRREDPLPQTSYVVLDRTPGDGVPVQDLVRRSVHVGYRRGVQLALRFRHRHQGSFTGSPGPRRLPCGPSTTSRIRPVIPRRPAEEPTTPVSVSCCLSAAGIRFLDHPVPLEISAFLTVGLPARLFLRAGLQPGFPRSARVRHDRGGCPLCPGAVVSSRPDRNDPIGTRRFPAASPTTPLLHPIAGNPQSRDLNQGFTHVHPSGLPLARNPRMERGPFGFPPSSAPCRYQQRTSGRGPTTRTLVGATPSTSSILLRRSHSHTVRPRVAPPPCGVPVRLAANPPCCSDNPGPQKPADQAQHLPIGDALGDQTHQDLVIDIVEAGGDVPLDHPLIAVAGELVDLGDGVLGPTSGPIPVAGG